MLIYKDPLFDDAGHKNYNWLQYELIGDMIVEYKYHKYEEVENGESICVKEKEKIESWNIDDQDVPEWLKKRALLAIKQNNVEKNKCISQTLNNGDIEVKVSLNNKNEKPRLFQHLRSNHESKETDNCINLVISFAKK